MRVTRNRSRSQTKIKENDKIIMNAEDNNSPFSETINFENNIKPKPRNNNPLNIISQKLY